MRTFYTPVYSYMLYMYIYIISTAQYNWRLHIKDSEERNDEINAISGWWAPQATVLIVSLATCSYCACCWGLLLKALVWDMHLSTLSRTIINICEYCTVHLLQNMIRIIWSNTLKVYSHVFPSSLASKHTKTSPGPVCTLWFVSYSVYLKHPQTNI